MFHKSRIYLPFIVLILLASASASANPIGDGTITYSGHIYLNGQPYSYTGPLTVQATLWDAAANGNALESVVVGYVNATDGEFFTTLPFSQTIITAYGFLWIEVGVKLIDDASYWLLYPRQSVSTSAYAVRSNYADTVLWANITDKPTVITTTVGGTDGQLAVWDSTGTIRSSFLTAAYGACGECDPVVTVSGNMAVGKIRASDSVSATDFLVGDYSIVGRYLPFSVWFSVTPNALSATTTGVYVCGWLGYGGKIERWTQQIVVATTNNASNYWTITLAIAGVGTVDSFNTASYSANSWTSVDRGPNYTVSTYGPYFRLDATKVGSPGTLSLPTPVVLFKR